MNTVKTILSLSFSGSLLILILLLTKPLFRHRVSRQWQYYIWLVAVARLTLPVSPRISLVGTLFQNMEQTVQEILFSSPAGSLDLLSQSGDDGAENRTILLSDNRFLQDNTAQQDSPRPQKADSPVSVTVPDRHNRSEVGSVILFLWLGTAAALLMRKITLYQSFVRFVRAGKKEISDPELLDRLAQTEEVSGVRQPAELWVNPLVSSPLLLGFFRPCIVLPSVHLPEEQLEYTIRHELTHYKRKDMFYKWLVQLTICLHWFNPLVWLMGRRIDQDCDLACDEAVISSLDAKGRQAYGDTLFHAVKAGGDYRNPLVSVTLGKDSKQLKERLGAIMGYKKPSRSASAVSLIFTVFLILGAHAAGAYADTGSQELTTNRLLLLGPAERMPKTNGHDRSSGQMPAGDNSVGSVRWASEKNSLFKTGRLSPAEENYEDGFLYTRQGYYEPPYLFEIGWNLWEESGNSYDCTDLSLSSGYHLPVYFTETCKSDLQDGKIRSSLTGILTGLWEETKDTEYPLIRPLVISIQNTGSIEPAVLAEQFYANSSLPQFQAVFALLDNHDQKRFLEKIYDDRNISFFSRVINKLDEDSPLLASFSEKSYSDGQINFFSVLAGRMTEDRIKSWLERAIKDGKVRFQLMLTSALSDDSEADEPFAPKEDAGAEHRLDGGKAKVKK